MTDPPEDDVVLASAARFLVDGGEEDAASVLLSCALEFWRSGDTWYVGDETHEALHVKLTGPRAAYEILNDSGHPTTRAIRRALEAVLPAQTYLKHFTVHVQHVAIDPNWRDELLQIARGVGVPSFPPHTNPGPLHLHVAGDRPVAAGHLDAITDPSVSAPPSCLPRGACPPVHHGAPPWRAPPVDPRGLCARRARAAHPGHQVPQIALGPPCRRPRRARSTGTSRHGSAGTCPWPRRRPYSPMA